MSFFRILLTSIFAICTLISITTTNPYTYTILNRTGMPKLVPDQTDRTIGQVTISVAEETVMAGTKYELTIPTTTAVPATGQTVTVTVNVGTSLIPLKKSVTVEPAQSGTISFTGIDAGKCIYSIQVNDLPIYLPQGSLCFDRTIKVKGIGKSLTITTY